MADVVVGELSGAFDVASVEPVAGFVSVVATHRFDTPGRTLILCGHLDVVPVEPDSSGWTRDPWGGEIVDGSLYGRGSLDMKGALAALITAARVATQSGPRLSGRLVLAAVADEESGGRRGAGTVIRELLTEGDGVIIGEPGDGAIRIAHRGMCLVEISTRGRATHASAPEGAVNAVAAMVRILAGLEGVELTHTPHPLLGRPSIAIGTTISGGTKANVIPDACTATLDVRKVPGMTDDSVLEDLHRRLTVLGLADTATLRVAASGEPSETSPDEEIVHAAAAAFEEEFGRRPTLGGMAAATDGWWFRNRLGIPTVMALGPGAIKDCHTVDEHVRVAELEAYSRLYLGIIRRFLCSGVD